MRNSSLKRSGMTRVNEGSHSFTCHPHVYPQVEWTIPVIPILRASPHFGRSSFFVPLRVEAWVGRSGWLQTEVVYRPQTVIHPSTNGARRRVSQAKPPRVCMRVCVGCKSMPAYCSGQHGTKKPRRWSLL